MSKPKPPAGRPKGYVHRIGGVWYLTYSIDALGVGGVIKPTRRKVRLGTDAELGGEEGARIKAEEVQESQKHATANMTVRAFVNGPFKEQHIEKVKQSSQKHWWTVLNNHILPALGDKRIDLVTPDDVERLVSLKLKEKKTLKSGRVVQGYSVQTVTHIKNCISGIYKHAIAKRIYQHANPAASVTLPEMIRKPKHALSLEQAGALVRALQERDPEVACMVLVSLLTSLNRAEILGLRWERVNLTLNPAISDGENLPPFSLRIQENYYLGRHSTVKVSTRERKVPLPMVVVQALLAHKAASTWTDPQDVVFCGPRRGVPVHARNISSDVLEPVAKKLGIPWAAGWHVYRHSYATIADQLDFSVTDRLAALGHSRMPMLLRYTSKQLEGRRAGAEEMAAKMLAEPAKKKAPQKRKADAPIPEADAPHAKAS